MEGYIMGKYDKSSENFETDIDMSGVSTKSNGEIFKRIAQLDGCLELLSESIDKLEDKLCPVMCHRPVPVGAEMHDGEDRPMSSLAGKLESQRKAIASMVEKLDVLRHGVDL